MENGLHNGMRTNHDRDTWTNGVNGGLVKHEMSSEKGKGLVVEMTNGGDGSMMDVDSEPHDGPGGAMTMATAHHTRMDDLPDEIQRITTDILPLNLILSRLAQYSHTKLMDQITALASKSLPQAAMNGNANYQFTGTEDTSNESLDKKVSLLKMIQDLHTRWVKALVIAEWSKKADKVSRLIDIRAHLAGKLDEFNAMMWNMIKAKQDLHWAKLPSPDLKTALEVLSSADVSWMPELGYIEPPPLTLQEKLSWIENINTMLSVRLSFDEYEKIPIAFRDYTIGSGRVTFKVKGEFEVDLTIGDEDPEKQFWFIDFRFLFTPAPAELADPVRAALEVKVNQVLGTDGLAGCYKYLHEFVLTQKITEFWRQAAELSRTRWIETLSVERLNRAMAIQYWVCRPHSQGSKSWIILGVNSNNGPEGLPTPKKPSCLVLRWFRDNKEVKEFDIPIDVDSISAESLLRTVIARHVEHLLGTIYSRLSAKPRFAQRHARLALEISKDEPSDSYLTLQLFDHENATVRVEGMTGAFTMLPPSQLIQDGQRKLNSSPNPAEDGPTMLESLRCYYTMKDLSSRARSIGWNMARGPISTEELKTMVQSASHSREVFHPVWLRKVGWTPQWFVILTMSLGGDQWWLVELAPQKPGSQGARMKMFTKIPMASSQLSLSDEFFQNLTIYVSGIISQITDLRELHTKRMQHAACSSLNYNLPPQIKLPTIFVRLSDMLRPRDDSKEQAPMSWAKEFIPIVFRGVQSSSEDQDMAEAAASQPRRDSRIRIIAEARLSVTNKAKFQLLKGNVDHDVAFDPRAGQFTLRLRADMGTPVVALLAARVRSLERLVDFIGSIRRAGRNVVAESVTLREVVFTYRSGGNDDPSATLPNPPQEETRAWRVRLDLAKDRGVKVTLEPGNPHLRTLDFLTQAANSAELEMLPSWLLRTLPLFRALDRIEAAWAPIVANNEGMFHIFHKGLSWLALRFTIAPGDRRYVNLEIKPRVRKGKMVWYVSRAGFGDAKSRNDEFNRALHQKVWSAQGDGIKGLGTSATADAEKGIEKLLDLIDQTVRSLVGTPPPPLGPAGGAAAQDATSTPLAAATPTQHQPQQSMQQAAQAQAQARLAHQAALRQQQANAQNQIHQRGGGGMGMGSSNSPVVVLD